MSIVMSEDAMRNFPPIPDGGVLCPFGSDWEPKQINGVWYWVKSVNL